MTYIVNNLGPKRAAIAVGLRWVVLQAEGKGKSAPRAAIRRQGTSVRAVRYVINPLDPSLCGFAAEPPPSPAQGGKKSKVDSYSLAALFLMSLQDAGIADQPCVLMMQPPSLPDKRVLVCTENRFVEVDALLDPDQAHAQIQRRLLSNPETRVFTDGPGAGPADDEETSIRISWSDVEELLTGKSRGSGARLKPLPVSPWGPLGALAVLATAGGFYAHHQLVTKPAKRAMLLQQVIAQDKTPAYIESLNRELTTAAWARRDLAARFAELATQPAFLAGWQLERLVCNPAGCKGAWKRAGGTIDALAKALPSQALLPAESEIDSATMTWQAQARYDALPTDQFKTLPAVQAEVLPVFQQLLNAGFSASLGEPMKVGADLNGVNPAAVIYRAPVEVAMPFSRATEVLAMLPPRVAIRSAELVLGSDMRITIKGSVYVK